MPSAALGSMLLEHLQPQGTMPRTAAAASPPPPHPSNLAIAVPLSEHPQMLALPKGGVPVQAYSLQSQSVSAAPVPWLPHVLRLGAVCKAPWAEAQGTETTTAGMRADAHSPGVRTRSSQAGEVAAAGTPGVGSSHGNGCSTSGRMQSTIYVPANPNPRNSNHAIFFMCQVGTPTNLVGVRMRATVCNCLKSSYSIGCLAAMSCFLA